MQNSILYDGKPNAGAMRHYLSQICTALACVTSYQILYNVWSLLLRVSSLDSLCCSYFVSAISATCSLCVFMQPSRHLVSAQYITSAFVTSCYLLTQPQAQRLLLRVSSLCSRCWAQLGEPLRDSFPLRRGYPIVENAFVGTFETERVAVL